MPVGNMENAQANSPESTSFSNSAVPRMPPTKAMRLLVRGSSMPNSGARISVCSSETSSRSMAERPLVNSGLKVEAVPLAAEVEGEVVFFRGTRDWRFP